jgi:hypothetical protein
MESTQSRGKTNYGRKPLLDGFQNDQSKSADSLSHSEMFSKTKQVSLMSPHQGSNQLATQNKVSNHMSTINSYTELLIPFLVEIYSH